MPPPEPGGAMAPGAGGAAAVASPIESTRGEQMARQLLSWTRSHHDRGPMLEDTTRAIALGALLLLVPALYWEAPVYLELLESRSGLLPYVPVEFSGLISVLVGTLLFLSGAYAAEVAGVMDADLRRRFYMSLAGAIGLGLLLAGVFFPTVTWELMLLLVYSLPGIIGVYAVALASPRAAYVLFVLLGVAILADRTRVEGWASTALLAVTMLVFVECVDGHARITRAMEQELLAHRSLAQGGLDEDEVRANYVVIQRRFGLVLAWTVAISTAVALLTVSSVGISAWAAGGGLPHSIEVESMSGLAIPILVAVLCLLAFGVHRSGLRHMLEGQGATAAMEVGYMGPIEDTVGGVEAARRGRFGRLTRALLSPTVKVVRRARTRWSIVSYNLRRRRSTRGGTGRHRGSGRRGPGRRGPGRRGPGRRGSAP